MERNVTVIPKSQIREKAQKERSKPGKIRVAAYCRVSTEMEEQQNSFENQVQYYTDYIQNNPNYELAGIYADEGISGTGTKKREEFLRMIEDCEAGKIDLVITKSISRFARNTADCLYYSRKLKSLGIAVEFQKENINTLEATGELLFTLLSSLAQEESRNISENTAWGIRGQFQKGISFTHGSCVMGYDQGPDHTLVINPEQAKIVRRIYAEFEQGFIPGEIAKHLNEEGIKGVHGRVCWDKGVIRAMLQNEIFKGDLLMQKVYTTDYLSHKIVKNDGKLEQYYVEGAHEAIIPPDEWEAVQEEIARRKAFRESHHIMSVGSANNGSPVSGKVFCAKCGAKYRKKQWRNIGRSIWTCSNREAKNGGTCENENVQNEILRKGFCMAWNVIVRKREEFLPGWKEKIRSGTPLERLRARQMIELTAEGELKQEIPELTRMVVEHIDVIDGTAFAFEFLDGTGLRIRVP